MNRIFQSLMQGTKKLIISLTIRVTDCLQINKYYAWMFYYEKYSWWNTYKVGSPLSSANPKALAFPSLCFLEQPLTFSSAKRNFQLCTLEIKVFLSHLLKKAFLVKVLKRKLILQQEIKLKYLSLKVGVSVKFQDLPLIQVYT